MSERLNIKSMYIEPEKEPKVTFDVERDISPVERSYIVAHRGSQLAQGFLAAFADLANFELQLGGQVPISSYDRERCNAERRRQLQGENWDSFASLALLELQLGGQVAISPEEREKITEERKERREDKHWSFFAPLATLELLLDQQNRKNDSLADDSPPLPENRKF